MHIVSVVVKVSIYTHYIDNRTLFRFNGGVKKSVCAPPDLPLRYRQLQRQLGQIGFVSQGSVFQRRPTQQGSRYVWTRKVKAKTVTVALSQEQYQWLRQAVANQRKLERLVRQMQQLSHQIVFTEVLGVARRKSLGKKVLDLI
jgi:virulence-associated protein VapD